MQSLNWFYAYCFDNVIEIAFEVAIEIAIEIAIDIAIDIAIEIDFCYCY